MFLGKAMLVLRDPLNSRESDKRKSSMNQEWLVGWVNTQRKETACNQEELARSKDRAGANSLGDICKSPRDQLLDVVVVLLQKSATSMQLAF